RRKPHCPGSPCRACGPPPSSAASEIRTCKRPLPARPRRRPVLSSASVNSRDRNHHMKLLPLSRSTEKGLKPNQLAYECHIIPGRGVQNCTVCIRSTGGCCADEYGPRRRPQDETPSKAATT